MENFTRTLATLEARLPHFFHGAGSLYRESKQKYKNVAPKTNNSPNEIWENMQIDQQAWLNGLCHAEQVLYKQVGKSFPFATK